MLDLVFVYNADSGAIAALLDLLHKTFSPRTYPCNLCAITYSTAGMRPEWRRFIKDLDLEVEFLHRDELEVRFGGRDEELPAVFRNADGRLDLLIDAVSINTCRTLNDLEQLVTEAISAREDQST